MKTVLLMSFAVVGILSGCSYGMEEVGLFKTGPDGLPRLGVAEFADQKISFEVVKSVSLKSCLQCHTSGGNSMNTPEKVIALQDRILEQINLGTMPPRSSGYKELTACEAKILETWLEDQKHNRVTEQKVKDLSACAGLQAPKEKPATDFKNLELSFANLKQEIFAPKCLSCHSAEKAKKTNLEDLAHINERELIKEKAEDSILYKIVVAPGIDTPKGKRFMPPTRSGMPAMTADEIDYLKRWIEAGAK